jgi:hypothetical protein
MWYLKELCSILEQPDDDLISKPLGSNTVMRAFIDNQGFEDKGQQKSPPIGKRDVFDGLVLLRY